MLLLLFGWLVVTLVFSLSLSLSLCVWKYPWTHTHKDMDYLNTSFCYFASFGCPRISIQGAQYWLTNIIIIIIIIIRILVLDTCQRRYNNRFFHLISKWHFNDLVSVVSQSVNQSFIQFWLDLSFLFHIQVFIENWDMTLLLLYCSV